MRITAKQRALMDVIIAGVDGKPCDIDQMLENLNYKTTKESLQFSLRALVAKGVIERLPNETRRAKSRAVYAPTESGMLHFAGGSAGDAPVDIEVVAPSVDEKIEVPEVFLGLGVESE